MVVYFPLFYKFLSCLYFWFRNLFHQSVFNWWCICRWIWDVFGIYFQNIFITGFIFEAVNITVEKFEISRRFFFHLKTFSGTKSNTISFFWSNNKSFLKNRFWKFKRKSFTNKFFLKKTGIFLNFLFSNWTSEVVLLQVVVLKGFILKIGCNKICTSKNFVSTSFCSKEYRIQTFFENLSSNSKTAAHKTGEYQISSKSENIENLCFHTKLANFGFDLGTVFLIIF